MAQSLSPDGRWALAIQPPPDDQLVLLPVGPGTPRRLEKGPIEHYSYFLSRWFPDGQQVLFIGNEPGDSKRCYMQDLAGGKPHRITPDGVDYCLPSPDGRQVLAGSFGEDLVAYPVEGGEPHRVGHLTSAEMPLGWSGGGRFIDVWSTRELSAAVYRLDLVTGRKERLKALMSNHTIDEEKAVAPIFTPDGKSYVYTDFRMLSDLYLVKGLK